MSNFATEQIFSAKDQYLIDLEDWKAAVAEAERQRSTMLSNLAAQEKKRLEDLANEKYNSVVAEIEAKKASIQNALAEAQTTLSALGFFQMGEKSRLKKQIETLNLKLSNAENKLNTARTTRDQEVCAITTKIARKKAEWKVIAEEAYPMPEEPCPPGMTPQMFASKKLQDALYETLRQYDMLTAEELFEKCEAAHCTNISRVNAMLRQMAGERVYQLERARRIYYQAKPERDPAEVAKENEKHKDAILKYLKSNGRCTVGDISNNCIEVMSLPIQRVSALVRLLQQDGKLDRTEIAGKTYFKLPTEQNRPQFVNGQSEYTILRSIQDFIEKADKTRLVAIAEENMLDLLHVSGISSAQEFFKVQILAARIGFEARKQLSEKQKHFATANLSKFYKGPMDDILPMLTGEITEPEYQAIESIFLAGREKTTIPLLTYILCFAYSDGKPSTSLEEKLVAIIRRINPKGMKAMASIKCKLCGGTIEINNENVAVCEFCGATQTAPQSNNTYEAK